MSDFAALKEHVRKLGMLLDDPQPGLFTWNEFVGREWRAIAQAWDSNIDTARLDALEANGWDLTKNGAWTIHEGTYDDVPQLIKADSLPTARAAIDAAMKALGTANARPT